MFQAGSPFQEQSAAQSCRLAERQGLSSGAANISRRDAVAPPGPGGAGPASRGVARSCQPHRLRAGSGAHASSVRGEFRGEVHTQERGWLSTQGLRTAAQREHRHTVDTHQTRKPPQGQRGSGRSCGRGRVGAGRGRHGAGWPHPRRRRRRSGPGPLKRGRALFTCGACPCGRRARQQRRGQRTWRCASPRQASWRRRHRRRAPLS